MRGHETKRRERKGKETCAGEWEERRGKEDEHVQENERAREERGREERRGNKCRRGMKEED